MKHFNLILIILFIISNTDISGQSISEKYPKIIEQVNLINNDSIYEKVTLNNEEFLNHMTDGGGELVGYFKNGLIQKITATVGLSYGIVTYNYYFNDENLIYVYETRDGFIYNEDLNKFDYAKTERNFAGQYFFKNDKLIDLETLGHNRFEDTEIDIEKTLLSEIGEYSKLVKQAKEYLNPTGTYKLDSKTRKTKDDIYGYFGQIQVKRLTKDQIIMTFVVNKGAPSYNSGSFVDTLVYKNNRSIYKTPDFDPSCKIVFDFTKNGINVVEKTDDYNNGCGFGHAVVANGYFKKMTSEIPELRHPMTNEKIEN